MYQNGFYSYPGFANFGYSAPISGMGSTMAGGLGGLGRAAATGARATQGGLFSKLLGGASKFNFSNFLGTTQKTLGVINQAIPVFYQVKPIWNNAKTMFRVMGALKEEPSNNVASSVVKSPVTANVVREASTTPITPVTIENQPQFFL